MTKTVKLEVAVEAETLIKLVGGQRLAVDWSKVPVNVVAQVLATGAKTMLINAFNGGGKDATEAERISQVEKKLQAWYRGEINVNNRGEAFHTLMRDAYRAEVQAQLGITMTDSAFRKMQEDTVQAATGKASEKGKAIAFDFFLECRAKIIAKRDKLDAGEVLESLTAKFTKAAEELSNERAKALAVIDTSGIDF